MNGDLVTFCPGARGDGMQCMYCIDLDSRPGVLEVGDGGDVMHWEREGWGSIEEVRGENKKMWGERDREKERERKRERERERDRQTDRQTEIERKQIHR